MDVVCLSPHLGHPLSDVVHTMAMNHHGNLFATVGATSQADIVTLWQNPFPDFASHPIPLLSLCGHSNPVRSLCFHRHPITGAEALLTASIDGLLNVWDVGRSEPLCSVFVPQAGCCSSLCCVRSAADGDSFACGGFDGAIDLFDYRTMQVRNRLLHKHTHQITDIFMATPTPHPHDDFNILKLPEAFSGPHAHSVISSGKDGRVIVHDVRTSGAVHVMHCAVEDYARSVSMARDSTSLLVFLNRGNAQLFDLRANKHVGTFRPPQLGCVVSPLRANIAHLAVDPTHQHLLVVSTSSEGMGSVDVYDVYGCVEACNMWLQAAPPPRSPPHRRQNRKNSGGGGNIISNNTDAPPPKSSKSMLAPFLRRLRGNSATSDASVRTAPQSKIPNQPPSPVLFRYRMASGTSAMVPSTQSPAVSSPPLQSPWPRNDNAVTRSGQNGSVSGNFERSNSGGRGGVLVSSRDGDGTAGVVLGHHCPSASFVFSLQASSTEDPSNTRIQRMIFHARTNQLVCAVTHLKTAETSLVFWNTTAALSQARSHPSAVQSVRNSDGSDDDVGMWPRVIPAHTYHCPSKPTQFSASAQSFYPPQDVADMVISPALSTQQARAPTRPTSLATILPPTTAKLPTAVFLPSMPSAGQEYPPLDLPHQTQANMVSNAMLCVDDLQTTRCESPLLPGMLVGDANGFISVLDFSIGRPLLKEKLFNCAVSYIHVCACRIEEIESPNPQNKMPRTRVSVIGEQSVHGEVATKNMESQTVRTKEWKLGQNTDLDWPVVVVGAADGSLVACVFTTPALGCGTMRTVIYKMGNHEQRVSCITSAPTDFAWRDVLRISSPDARFLAQHSASNKLLVCSGSADHTLRIWVLDHSSKSEFKELHTFCALTFGGHSDEICDIALVEPCMVGCVCSDGSVWMWGLDSGCLEAQYTGAPARQVQERFFGNKTWHQNFGGSHVPPVPPLPSCGLRSLGVPVLEHDGIISVAPTHEEIFTSLTTRDRVIGCVGINVINLCDAIVKVKRHFSDLRLPTFPPGWQNQRLCVVVAGDQDGFWYFNPSRTNAEDSSSTMISNTRIPNPGPTAAKMTAQPDVVGTPDTGMAIIEDYLTPERHALSAPPGASRLATLGLDQPEPDAILPSNTSASSDDADDALQTGVSSASTRKSGASNISADDSSKFQLPQSHQHAPHHHSHQVQGTHTVATRRENYTPAVRGNVLRCSWRDLLEGLAFVLPWGAKTSLDLLMTTTLSVAEPAVTPLAFGCDGVLFHPSYDPHAITNTKPQSNAQDSFVAPRVLCLSSRITAIVLVCLRCFIRVLNDMNGFEAVARELDLFVLQLTKKRDQFVEPCLATLASLHYHPSASVRDISAATMTAEIDSFGEGVAGALRRAAAVEHLVQLFGSEIDANRKDGICVCLAKIIAKFSVSGPMEPHLSRVTSRLVSMLVHTNPIARKDALEALCSNLGVLHPYLPKHSEELIFQAVVPPPNQAGAWSLPISPESLRQISNAFGSELVAFSSRAVAQSLSAGETDRTCMMIAVLDLLVGRNPKWLEDQVPMLATAMARVAKAKPGLVVSSTLIQLASVLADRLASVDFSATLGILLLPAEQVGQIQTLNLATGDCTNTKAHASRIDLLELARNVPASFVSLSRGTEEVCVWSLSQGSRGNWTCTHVATFHEPRLKQLEIYSTAGQPTLSIDCFVGEPATPDPASSALPPNQRSRATAFAQGMLPVDNSSSQVSFSMPEFSPSPLGFKATKVGAPRSVVDPAAYVVATQQEPLAGHVVIIRKEGRELMRFAYNPNTSSQKGKKLGNKN